VLRKACRARDCLRALDVAADRPCHPRVDDLHDGFIDDVSLKGPVIGLGVDFRASVRQGPRLRWATAPAVAVSDEA
jgi:hypothetical protein